MLMGGYSIPLFPKVSGTNPSPHQKSYRSPHKPISKRLKRCKWQCKPSQQKIGEMQDTVRAMQKQVQENFEATLRAIMQATQDRQQ